MREVQEGFFGAYAPTTPRDQLLQHGPECMTDGRLLSVALGIKPKQAEVLLGVFGGLRGVFNAEQRQFCASKGVSDARYAQAQAVREVCTRYMREKIDRTALKASDPETVKQYLTAKIRDLDHEVFMILFLDNRHRLIRDEAMFRGTIDGAAVYPREIVKRALQLNAAAVIFAHNHPSGVAEPSHADRDITKRLQGALNTIDVRTLDHFVVGDGVITSFSERGWL